MTRVRCRAVGDDLVTVAEHWPSGSTAWPGSATRSASPCSTSRPTAPRSSWSGSSGRCLASWTSTGTTRRRTPPPRRCAPAGSPSFATDRASRRSNGVARQHDHEHELKQGNRHRARRRGRHPRSPRRGVGRHRQALGVAPFPTHDRERPRPRHRVRQPPRGGVHPGHRRARDPGRAQPAGPRPRSRLRLGGLEPLGSSARQACPPRERPGDRGARARGGARSRASDPRRQPGSTGYLAAPALRSLLCDAGLGGRPRGQRPSARAEPTTCRRRGHRRCAQRRPGRSPDCRGCHRPAASRAACGDELGAGAEAAGSGRRAAVGAGLREPRP